METVRKIILKKEKGKNMETIFQGLKSWKTSGLGAAGVIVWLGGHFGVGIDAETAQAIIVVLGFIFAYVSKDATATHLDQ